MKKIIIVLISMFISFCALAQKDTTIVNGPVKMDYETSINKAGNEKTEYFASYKGTVYITDKTSYKRYYLYKRFNCTPTYAIIDDSKTKAKKLIIL